MTDSLTIAAFLRRLMTHLLVALLALGSLGTASSVFAAGDPCLDEGCPCDVESDDHADDGHDDPHVAEADNDSADPCCDTPCADADAETDDGEHEAAEDPCRTNCDDCQCSVASAHAGLMPAGSGWRPACAGLGIDHRAPPPGRLVYGTESRLERPPRSSLC